MEQYINIKDIYTWSNMTMSKPSREELYDVLNHIEVSGNFLYVTHCKDCKHCVLSYNQKSYVCERNNIAGSFYIKPDDYCSFAERISENDTHNDTC